MKRTEVIEGEVVMDTEKEILQLGQDMYKMGKQDAADVFENMLDLQDSSEVIGAIKFIKLQKAHNEFMRYAMLYRIRESKKYKAHCKTWDEFCVEKLGEAKRTVDEKIADLKPLFEEMGSESAQLLGLPLNKFRHLGRALGGAAQIEDGEVLVVDDVRVELKPENKDEIIALIEDLRSKDRQASVKDLEERGKELERTKKTVGAKQRELKALHAKLDEYEKRARAG
ncbi:MAG: hypothetical protein GY765_10865, partial [bacterium]|nr:hypothetical protein [bacterium]